MKWIELFAGGGGVGTGLKQAGHAVAAAVELDSAIAQCYRTNHPDTLVIASDVRRVDISNLPQGINALWASPSCEGHSQARSKHLPAREDADIGLAILPYLTALQPELVVIENVQAYEKHRSFATIVSYLIKSYSVSLKIIDMADYGVPQSRVRMILQARRGPIAWPNQTRRIGWYEGLQGLLKNLPDTELAQWQRDLLKPEYCTSPLLIYGFYDYRRSSDERNLSYRHASDPSKTIVSSHNALASRAYFPDIGQCKKLDVVGNAKLQTFPDTYIWPCVKTKAMEIIGNAVPPLFVQRLTELYSWTF